MKNLLLFLIFCAAFGTIRAQGGYLTEFKQKWANAKDYTLEVAQLMPEEQYGYRPSEEQMSFREQLLHMVGNMGWLSSSYLGAKKLEADLKKKDYSKDELLDILMRSFDRVMESVEKLETEVLDEEVTFFAGPMTKRQILTLLNDHLTHHRAQLIVYLRLQGVQPPNYRGW